MTKSRLDNPVPPPYLVQQMLPGDELPKLKMAPRENAEDLARRVQRERRASETQREGELEDSLAPFRVGSVPYLNSVPLVRGLETQVRFAPPSELGALLRHGELDAALMSITEALLNDHYDVLDGIAVASLGEVKSVFLAHRKPLQEIRTVACDPASLTSVNLLKVLLAEKGLKPEFQPLDSYAHAAQHDYVLLIGNPAIDFLRSAPDHQIWDLGAAWYELTNLPFVYAAWTLRRGVENARLRRLLREARDFGMDTLDYLIHNRTEYDLEFRKDYLGWHIHYHLGSDEKRGLAKFQELLVKHGLGPVFPLNYV
ncbi:MAG: menaquinone biosynthesis protein [Verrucomicrobiales bacterium]|nr:menaquinone biosynthesis protein [Verrucomicrobiales bacterium]